MEVTGGKMLTIIGGFIHSTSIAPLLTQSTGGPLAHKGYSCVGPDSRHRSRLCVWGQLSALSSVYEAAHLQTALLLCCLIGWLIPGIWLDRLTPSPPQQGQ